jgi:rhodanese-related sulfurtransferase
MAAWKQAGLPIDMVIDIEADELAMDLPHDDKLVILDVRNKSEFAEGHVVAAENVPLSDFADAARVAILPEDANLYLYSHQVNRSLTAATMLKKNGLHNLRIINGGWLAIKEQSGIPTEKEPGVLN